MEFYFAFSGSALYFSFADKCNFNYGGNYFLVNIRNCNIRKKKLNIPNFTAVVELLPNGTD